MIQLLLDANISWRLMANLKKHFNNCLHVDHVGLKTPDRYLNLELCFA